MNWGKSIIVAFVLFAIFIGVLVTVCVRQEVSLVSADYYQEELAYQQQIERLANTEALAIKPSIELVNDQLEIRFPYFTALDKGELKLFRPSDVSMVKSYRLQASVEDVQRIDVHHLPRGMYKARMQWSMQGKEYYMERMVNL